MNNFGGDIIKICLITPYYKPIKGGISNYILHVSKALNNEKQEVYVITRQGKKDTKTTYVADVSKIQFILKTFIYILNLKPDVLHSHSAWYTLLPCIMYKYLRPKTVVIHTFHTDPILNSSSFKCFIFSFLLSKCNSVTFVSKYLQDKIKKLLDIRTKTSIIYGGTDINKLENKDIEMFREKYNIRKHYPIICYIGVLSWKPKAEGVKILIRSFNQIIKEFPNSLLIIVGDGVYRKEIELIAEELGICSEIIFTGFIENPSSPLYICDIYTHISLQEGFPLAVLEAMSCEKAVIASKVGGIPEVIIDGENGLLVEATPEAISNAIIDLANSPEKRSNLGLNAKITIQRKYTWSEIAQEFINLYQMNRG